MTEGLGLCRVWVNSDTQSCCIKIMILYKIKYNRKYMCFKCLYGFGHSTGLWFRIFMG